MWMPCGGFPPRFPHRGFLQREFPLGPRLQRRSDAEAVRALSADTLQLQMGSEPPILPFQKMGISLIFVAYSMRIDL